jgi:hypothetical protein
MIPERGTLQFSSPQRSLVFNALNEAEARTTGYYCIPPFRWEQLHYDLLTREDHGWEPIPDPMLARVRLLERTGIRRSFNFYRIELNDHSILTAAERENLLQASELYPFFVYILTHEMVHLVRLSTILNDPADSAIPCNDSEEHRVQEISRQILSGYSDLLPKLDSFCSSRPHLDAITDNPNQYQEVQ